MVAIISYINLISTYMKIMHIAEPFATGVLSFLIDITKRQVEMNDIYILYGIRLQYLGIPLSCWLPGVGNAGINNDCIVEKINASASYPRILWQYH